MVVVVADDPTPRKSLLDKVTNIYFNEACGGLKYLHTPLLLF